jgi:hypothetical protein
MGPAGKDKWLVVNVWVYRKAKNLWFNWHYGVRPYVGKGCVNMGITRDGKTIVKFDWDKPFQYTSPRVDFTGGIFSTFSKRVKRYHN